jgi:hypothetical protein
MRRGAARRRVREQPTALSLAGDVASRAQLRKILTAAEGGRPRRVGVARGRAGEGARGATLDNDDRRADNNGIAALSLWPFGWLALDVIARLIERDSGKPGHDLDLVVQFGAETAGGVHRVLDRSWFVPHARRLGLLRPLGLNSSHHGERD